MKHMTFKAMYEEVEKHPDYWAEPAMLYFSEDVLAAMRAQSVTRAELARRLGTSPGHVTRLLGGSGNLTPATMSRMAFALGLELRTSLLPMAAARSAAGQPDAAAVASRQGDKRDVGYLLGTLLGKWVSLVAAGDGPPRGQDAVRPTSLAPRGSLQG